MDINGSIDQTTFLIDINTDVQNVKIKTFEIMACACLIQGCRFAPAGKHTPASKNISQNQVGKLDKLCLGVFFIMQTHK